MYFFIIIVSIILFSSISFFYFVQTRFRVPWAKPLLHHTSFTFKFLTFSSLFHSLISIFTVALFTSSAARCFLLRIIVTFGNYAIRLYDWMVTDSGTGSISSNSTVIICISVRNNINNIKITSVCVEIASAVTGFFFSFYIWNSFLFPRRLPTVIAFFVLNRFSYLRLFEVWTYVEQRLIIHDDQTAVPRILQQSLNSLWTRSSCNRV